MISYLGFASSVQSCYGEGGALQIDIAVCGEHSLCSGHTGFAQYRDVWAFPIYTAQAPGCCIWSGPCAECGSSFRVLHKSADSVAPAFCAFPGLSGSGRQGLGLTLPGCGRLFPPGRAAQGARGSGGLSPGAVRLFPSLPQHALPVGCLRLAFVQRSWSLATTLPVANVDHPESQEVFR